MSNRFTAIRALLVPIVGVPTTEALFAALVVDTALDTAGSDPANDTTPVSRAQLAQALNMLLFDGLLDRVPSGAAHVREIVASGSRAALDHGALRTVAWPHNGTLPSGKLAITRVLEPLGYRIANVYPLPALKMTGFALTHADFPQTISQFFVSELHPEAFSPAFQAAVTRVVSSSTDPLTANELALLDRLATHGSLPLTDAHRLLPAMVRCFARHHPAPALADYEVLKAESVEMAWIATEGNVFNHATDRVPDVYASAAAQRAAGRAIKERVEVSRSGRVRQTALVADPVIREFIDASGLRIARQVPGSFYEFITRDPLPDGGGLDLSFDSGNATGIFSVTGGQAAKQAVGAAEETGIA